MTPLSPEQEMRLARRDPLTGTLNRRTFRGGLSYLCRRNVHAGLLLMAVDGFRDVNARYGWDISDHVLRSFANDLQSMLPEASRVFRTGSDEFAVLALQRTPSDTSALAHEMYDLLHSPTYRFDDTVLNVQTSMGGIHIFPEDDRDSAYSRAFRALDRAKRSRGTDLVLDLEPHAEKNASHDIDQRLRAALRGDGGLMLYAQPIVDLRTGETAKYELLVRLDFDGRVLSPGQFLPIAEERRYISKLDIEVMRLASEIVTRYPDQRFSVNLSSQTVGDSSASDSIAGMVRELGLDEGQMIIEVTETTAVTNPERAVRLMNECREYGARFAIDDFGVGYSTFSVLRDWPLTYAKIDGDFVKRISEDSRDRILVQTMSDVFKDFGLRSVGEFVETRETADALKDLDIDYGQGYLYGKPEPLERQLH